MTTLVYWSRALMAQKYYLTANRMSTWATFIIYRMFQCARIYSGFIFCFPLLIKLPSLQQVNVQFAGLLLYILFLLFILQGFYF